MGIKINGYVNDSKIKWMRIRMRSKIEIKNRNEHKRKNQKCFICDKTFFTLDGHHLDKNHDNNSKENIRWICPNCHMSIHGKRKIPNNFVNYKRYQLIKKFRTIAYFGCKEVQNG